MMIILAPLKIWLDLEITGSRMMNIDINNTSKHSWTLEEFGSEYLYSDR